jgi:hypothetical protein
LKRNPTSYLSAPKKGFMMRHHSKFHWSIYENPSVITKYKIYGQIMF